MQTQNVTALGLNQWAPTDKLNSAQFTEDNRILTLLLRQLFPTGSILPFGGQPDENNDPPGFLFLTPGGREVSRETYADLFSVIGTTYGSGDGSATFKLPDMAGRFPLGYDANLGAVGGADKQALSIAQLPPLSFTVSVSKQAYNGITGNYIPVTDYPFDATTSRGSAQTNSLGSGSPVNNMPPYLALAYIIKT